MKEASDSTGIDFKRSRNRERNHVYMSFGIHMYVCVCDFLDMLWAAYREKTCYTDGWHQHTIEQKFIIVSCSNCSLFIFTDYVCVSFSQERFEERNDSRNDLFAVEQCQFSEALT